MKTSGSCINEVLLTVSEHHSKELLAFEVYTKLLQIVDSLLLKYLPAGLESGHSLIYHLISETHPVVIRR